MATLFTNNASAPIASTITSSATSITVASGQGAEFPVLAGSDNFTATLVDTSNNIEIVQVTARSGDTMTVVRGQEGTTARGYAAGSLLELRITAAVLNNFAQIAGAQTFTGVKTFSSTIVGSTTNISTTALSVIYPIGSIYTSTVATNPGTLFGFGTWVAFGSGQVMIGNGGGFSAGATGGSADAIVVSHTHTATSNVSDPGHTHAFTTGTGNQDHTHLIDTYIGINAGSGGTGYAGNNGGGGSAPSEATQPSGANHTHSGTTGAITTGVTVATSISTAGASGTNANLQPYIVVYMWNRTA